MKTVKLIGIVVASYVGVVVTFESLIGFFQPGDDGTLVITTTDENGRENDRVLSRLESDGDIYVSANHWPRAWYNQALANPKVQVALKSEKANYLAVPVSGEEHDRVNAEHRHGIVFLTLTGFPPRYFLRLDPR